MGRSLVKGTRRGNTSKFEHNAKLSRSEIFGEKREFEVRSNADEEG